MAPPSRLVAAPAGAASGCPPLAPAPAHLQARLAQPAVCPAPTTSYAPTAPSSVTCIPTEPPPGSPAAALAPAVLHPARASFGTLSRSTCVPRPEPSRGGPSHQAASLGPDHGPGGPCDVDTASLLLQTPRPPRGSPAASPGPQPLAELSPLPGGLFLRPLCPALGHPFRRTRTRPSSPRLRGPRPLRGPSRCHPGPGRVDLSASRLAVTACLLERASKPHKGGNCRLFCH